MKLSIIALLLTIAGIVSAEPQSQQGSSTVIRVIPAPQVAESSAQIFKPTSQTRLILGEGSSKDDQFAAEQINIRLAEFKKGPLQIMREQGVRKISKNFIFLGSPQSEFAAQWLRSKKLSLGPQLKEQGYLLDVSQDGIVILGESPCGRFYGIMTLVQLIEQQKKSVLARGVRIQDWPQQSFRGISDDLSRGQVSTMDNFKKIIRFLAIHKLNVYSPYIEDIFVFKNHPLIGKGRGEITAAEVKELDAYAKRYHVELVPTFETLGHWENILALPEYVKYAEFPGAQTINVSDERVYTLLDEMIGELSDAFSSPWFNIAADESYDVGLGANKARVAASDLATVHAEHYKRVFDILTKYHKKPMMYGDIILNNPTILDKIPKNVVIIDWHYGAQAQYNSPQTFKSAGFPFVVSPAVWNFTGPFPNYINTMINIQNFNRDGFLNGSMGLLTSNWNDYGGEDLRELNYYGYAWTAECAWRPLTADVEKFDQVFFPQFFGTENAALQGEMIYAFLSNPLNQVNWAELWRHPLLSMPSGRQQSTLPIIWRLQSLESTMPLVEQSASGLQHGGAVNQNQFRITAFAARLVHWFGEKVSVADRLKRIAQDTVRGSAHDSVLRAGLTDARAVVAELHLLKDEFRSLWLETNRSANLDLLMMRYERQIQYWDETIRSLERTGTLKDPAIESQWIFHPRANPGRRDSSVSQVSRAYFRKVFTLDRPPLSAKVQLIGDTHAKVWVNGIEVGEVYARRSLSLVVEQQRVKMWEVSSLLKPGENLIAVEAENYDRSGSAGINIYAEVKIGEETMKILSDSSWKVATAVSEKWNTSSEKDQDWENAMPKPYSSTIIQPNFDTGRLSWIER